MTKSERTESTAGKAGLSYSDSVYRCVCGRLLDIDPQKDTDCPECDRHYDAGFLGDDEGDETVLATLCERRTKIVTPLGEKDPLIDQQWGHFRIIEPLGQGGMGTVYRALDESLQRYVALKVIVSSGGGEDGSKHVQQLFQEARAQARVNHPNVVHIYFVDRSHGSPFLAMELVNGPTLKDLLEDGPLPFTQVINIALQIASALDFALKYDIVHGDIKPSNILVAENKEIKISDFGLARRLSELQAGKGVLAGTPNYMSPEAAARSSTDFRSDLYSLGVTLFELTFGKLPYSFGAKTVEERLEAHRFRPVEFPEIWPESVPVGFRSVLEKLLAKDRGNRYQSYEALIEDLEETKPLSIPSAALIPRGLAWLTDLFCLFFITVVLFLPIKLAPLVEVIGNHALLSWLIHIVVAIGVPTLAIYYQWSRGTSPGKQLFQLRVVDSHGATPSKAQIASRTGMQFLILWMASFFGFVEEFGVNVNDVFIQVTVLIALLVEMACVVFSRKRLSLHDRLFRTRVVLDARENR